ncbi:MAG: hypothetical protein HOC77_05825 [Chloroflexi bacterium]|jgi:hypothetical protein|nr:hypothetical protein [Chloroflexota bacterium]MBT4074172.1 hypothetical protein [Chloroflexota bacterium]MBT4514593.1 hypothetical protein [Chloroflexota bacterium]MBT5318551.1 hypothetical protein [Chloroflexota bacterium]MBT6682160.1 hypothetical protein [Chloroflexota bacterium]
MPSRSLWVPFELGRPLGVPDDADFQIGVLKSLLGLFNRKSGPVIEDYPIESPVTAETDAAWSCTIPLPPLPDTTTPAEALKQALLQEVGSLAPWHAESMRRMGRTSFGLSGLTPESMPEVAAFLADVASGENPEPLSGLSEPLPIAIRYMADDAKAYYMEAANEQPGSDSPGGTRMWTWIYHETRMGQVFYDLRDRLASEYADRMAANGGERPPGPPPINPISARFAVRPEPTAP